MSERSYEKCPIAIIGMSCRLPGASNPDELWKMLVEQRHGFRPLDERWNKTLLRPRKDELKPPVPRAGLLDSIEGFDAAFFGISPREAARMDPQQRILLELAWEAFEEAGIPPERYAGERVGVFVGFSVNDYWSVTTDSAHRADVDAWTNLGGSSAILANRISHALDLRGPSVAIDSACSASLYALHIARASLEAGECCAALVGGINVLAKPETTLGFARATMLSPTGESRPFASDVNGYVRGEGGAVVLLKRLEDALAEGDPIRGLILGSAVSQGGRSPGITVPSADAQAQMLELAYRSAGVDPRRVRYVEAHGTGTPVGDPVEAEALGRVVGTDREPDRACVIGSIKSNIGHLEAAAGIAGLAKALVCFEHDAIAPSLATDRPSPRIPFDELGLRLADRVEPLRLDAEPALVGVSAFGFGGTNAHVVLRQHRPVRERTPVALNDATQSYLVPLSARGERSLRAFARELAASLRARADLDPADVAHTLALRRTPHRTRAVVVAASRERMAEQLERLAKESPVAEAPAEPERVAFVFSGMGPQWWGMARQLLNDEPVFRRSVQRIDAAFARVSGWSILGRVFLAPEQDVPSLVERADLGHPAHFALQIGICDLLRSWGICPDAIVGHSAGEVSSAYASGVLSLEDAVAVLHHRSRLVQMAAGLGNLLAAGVSESEAAALVGAHGDVCVAAVNAPSSVALSGPRDALERIRVELEARERFARFVPGSLPYHSAAFEPIREELVSCLEKLEPRPAETPVVSTVTGSWASGGDFGASYWWRNVRERVEFEAAIRTLHASGCSVFVEIGAHPALLRSIKDSAAGADAVRAIPTLQRDGNDRETLLGVVGELWVAGHRPDWEALDGSSGALARLPHYAWQHEPYWVDAPAEAARPEAAHPVRGDRTAADRPTWQAQLSETSPAWAADHRFNGQSLVPGVAWIDAWLGAALEEGTMLPLAIEQLRFTEMRPLGPTPICVRTRRSGERWTTESATAPDAGEWTLHASARRSREILPDTRSPMDDRLTHAPSESFDYPAYEPLGYGYGPRFQSVERLWRIEGLALAELRLSAVDASAADAHVVHPALFDGAFQTILAAAGKIDGVYLPVGVELVCAYRAHDATCGGVFARAEIRSAGAGEVCADVELTQGEHMLLRARGVRFARIGASRMLQRRALYQERWVRRASAPEAETPSAAEAPAPGALLAGGWAEHDAQTSMHAALDGLARAYLAEALPELGASDPNLASAVTSLLRLGAIDARHAGWCRRLARDAARAEASQELRARVTERHPEAHVERQLVERIGAELPRILAGDVERNEVVRAAGDGLEALFNGDARTVRAAHLVLRRALEREVASAGPVRPLRILEIGDGTGGLAAWLLPVVDPARTDYLWTDASDGPLEVVRQRFRGFPFLATAVLDIERELVEQSFAERDFDVVVMSGARRRTRALDRVLVRCRELLRPGGLLLQIEPAARSAWMDLVFDHTEAPRPTLEEWPQRLSATGFADARCAAVCEGGLFACIAARTPQRIPAPRELRLPDGERWLVVANGPLGAIFAERLRRGGRACTLASPTDPLPAVEDLDRALFCCSPGIDPGPGVLPLLRLAQHLASREIPLGVITCGAQQMAGEDAARDPVQAAAWGFARVLASEHPELTLRLIDLPTEPDADAAVAALAELADLSDAGAREVAIRGTLRFEPRLAAASPESVELRSNLRAPSWEVAVDRPGDLTSTVFRERERRAPAEAEIEVQIEAMALNFHDLLFALGFLDAESSTDATHGRIGYDCVGTVSRIGPGVERFRVGDRVVGIALGSAASYATGAAELFVPLPEGMPAGHAVGLPMVAATVEMALRESARLRAGETLLVHSGAGAVGLSALRLARSVGARVFATAGTPEKRAWLRALGAERAMDSHSDAFHAEVLEATGGRGVDVVLNSLSGELLAKSFSLLAPGGRFVELGKRDVYADRPLGMRQLARNGAVHVVDLEWLVGVEPARARELLQTAFEDARSGALPPIPYVCFPAERIEEAFRLMASGRHTGKLVVTLGDVRVDVRPQRTSAAPIRPDASYLVTGGLSGLGLATARWLARRGARHLALLGRSGAASEEARSALSELERDGVRVEVIRADVAVRADLERALAHIASTLPPLRGVFHAAMQIEDASIARLTPEAVMRVLKPKAVGAWNLHEALRDAPLDLFVLYSSVSRLLGTPGQASYVAANEYLAALAALRRAGGLPATCIDWGTIQNTGYVARSPDLLARLLETGAESMSAEDALAALEQVLCAGVSTLGIGGLDWGRLESAFPRTLADARFVEVRPRNVRSARADAHAVASDPERIQSGTPEQREVAAIDVLRTYAGRILRSPPQSLSVDQPLTELGFDSLMEVELRANLQQLTGLESSRLLALRNDSLRSLARRIVGTDGPAKSEPAKRAVPASFLGWIDAREQALRAAFDCHDVSAMMRELETTLLDLERHVERLDDASHTAHRAAFHPRLAHFFLESPLLRRAHDKPLGYPGDFQMMSHIYVNEPQGNPREQVVDEFALALPAAVSNRNRIQFVTDVLAAAAARASRLRVASVGCGPAKEIHALLRSDPALAARIDLVLVDQDMRALDACRADLASAPPGFRVDYLCAPVEDLARDDSAVTRALGPCDVIYSIGLFDYFNDRSFARHLQLLYARLRPGGKLVVGNLSRTNPARWMMEYVTDWFLCYRSPRELEDHAERLVPRPERIEASAEPLGINLFLLVDRPALPSHVHLGLDARRRIEEVEVIAGR